MATSEELSAHEQKQSAVAVALNEFHNALAFERECVAKLKDALVWRKEARQLFKKKSAELAGSILKLPPPPPPLSSGEADNPVDAA